ncbi:MAG: isocitrate/isopropylmalate family dehydrogenase, partial [Eubacteriales bacterium]|nr:isocitrate/isopropylmalate family dehydrogenase [Eubacteriales bacterium]
MREKENKTGRKHSKTSKVKEIVDFGIKEMGEMADVSDAVAQFRTLLLEQLARVEKMEAGKDQAMDFEHMPVITIGICPGDGIGPSISEQTVRVLSYLLKDEIDSGKVVLKPIEGLTIENRLAQMEAVPEDVLEEIKKCNVLLKGPTTTPKGGSLESANVKLRRELDLYAKIRPVEVPEEGIDWIFFRENTEGEYALGSRGVEIPGKLAVDFKVIT